MRPFPHTLLTFVFAVTTCMGAARAEAAASLFPSTPPRVLDIADCMPVWPQQLSSESPGGEVAISYQVDAAGKLLETKMKSSGVPELDAEALRSLKRCRFAPGTGDDGRPAAKSGSLRYVFKPGVPADAAAAGGVAVEVSPAVVDYQRCSPEYPKASFYLEQQGTVELSYRVDAAGKLLDMQIGRSSGMPLLDAATLKAFLRCEFTPGTRNGQPVEMPAQIRYVWEMGNRPGVIAVGALGRPPAAVKDAALCTPPWPQEALDASQQGAVDLNFVLDADGKVQQSSVRKSSGFASLDAAALAALRGCVFTPAVFDRGSEYDSRMISYVFASGADREPGGASVSIVVPPSIQHPSACLPAPVRRMLEADHASVLQLVYQVGADAALQDVWVDPPFQAMFPDGQSREILKDCAFTAATVNGLPVTGWANLVYRFGSLPAR
jgi:TonB family protein